MTGGQAPCHPKEVTGGQAPCHPKVYFHQNGWELSYMTASSRRLKKIYSIMGQLTLVAMYPALFHAAAYLGEANFHKKYGMKPFPLATFIIFGVMLVLTVITGIIFRNVITKSEEDKYEDAKEKKKGILCGTVLTLILILMRFPMLGTFQRWDAGEYFFTVGSSTYYYNLTLHDFFYQFGIAYHPNYGFSTFVALPLFFGHRNVMLATAWQIVFSILAVLALYEIFRKSIGMSSLRAMLSALAVGCVPIFLGLSVYCTPDYYMVLFFIFALYFGMKKWHVLETFMLLMMCFSKETSAVIVLGYYGVRILYRIFMKNETGGFLPRVKNVICSSELWVAFTTGALFVIGYLFNGSTWADRIEAGGGAAIDIGFNRPYAAMKVKQYLISNFAWVVSIIFILSVLVIIGRYIYNRRKGAPDKSEEAGARSSAKMEEAGTKPTSEMESAAQQVSSGAEDIKHREALIQSRNCNMLLLGMMGAMACFAAVGILMHVSAIERYNIFFAVGLVIIALLAEFTAFKGISFGKNVSGDSDSQMAFSNRFELLQCFMIFIMCMVLGLESYITVDPVTRRIFPQVPIGHHTMNYESEYMEYFGDGLVTNYQYAWIDKAFDKLLLDIDYDVNDTIFFPTPESGVVSGVQFEGNSGYFRVGWFPELKRRGYYDYEMSGNWQEMSIHAVSSDETWFPYSHYTTEEYMTDEFVTDNATLCFVPYFEKLGVTEPPYLKCAGVRYHIGPRKESTVYRGTIAYYPMVIHDSYVEGIDIRMVCDGLSDRIKGKAFSGNPSEVDITDEPVLSDEEYQKDIEAVYGYLASGYLKIDRINDDTMVDIDPLQSLYLDVELYDREGNLIELEHSNKTATVKTGSGELLREIDEALVDMKAGETRDVQVKIPPRYPELEEYEGQTLTARLMPVKIACTLYYDIDKETEDMLRARAKEIVDIRIINEEFHKTQGILIDTVMKNVLDENDLSSGADIVSEMAAECEPSEEVEKYFEQYLAGVGLSEEEFYNDYLRMSADEYKVCKYILGKMKTSKQE